MFPLSTISDWLAFLPSVEGEQEYQDWIIRIHSFSNEHARLVFEKELHEDGKNVPGLLKYILSCPAGVNSLQYILKFLEVHGFSLEKILAALDCMQVIEDEDACYGVSGEFHFTVMKFEAR